MPEPVLTAAPVSAPDSRLRVAVIGAGVAGLGAAWALARRHDVTLYERDGRLGGHANTVDVAGADGRPLAVDTGFIVYNEPNYPELARLFAHLGVATQPCEMSFAVSLDGGRLEYASDVPRGILAQPVNLLRPRFLAMLADIGRFYRMAPKALATLDGSLPLGDWLRAERFGDGFVRDHLLPMAAAIWSAPPRAMLDFPALTLLRFFANHGLSQRRGRPRWRTVADGSRAYVAALAADLRAQVRTGCGAVAVRRESGVVVVRDALGGEGRFDRAVVAVHADQALALLADADADECRLLGAFRYQENRAVLHGDAGLMPRRRDAWASWNYLAAGDGGALAVTYWMNRLQHLPPAIPLFVTLNPPHEPRATYGEFVYHHPMFDAAALAAQRDFPRLQGRRATWFCGSYRGYGFHEDALASGLAAAAALGAPAPWTAA